MIAPFCRELFYEWKSIVFILMVPTCSEICKIHLCYLHLGKWNKFYNLYSCDLISNNCNQFLTYLGTTRLSPLTVSFLRKRKQIQILSISLYIEHAMLPKLETSWKCDFTLKLLRQVVVSILVIRRNGNSLEARAVSYCFTCLS